MVVTINEAKSYLRVDFDDDDLVINSIINTAEKLVSDTLRKELTDTFFIRIAVLYCVAYLYEHRENADMAELTKNLRHLLSTEREEKF